MIEEENGEDDAYTNEDQTSVHNEANHEENHHSQGLQLDDQIRLVKSESTKDQEAGGILAPERQSSQNRISSSSSKSLIDTSIPSIVRDIEQMERDFTQFLESIYNWLI